MFYFLRKYKDLSTNPLWTRLSSFTIILFFVFLAEAILSFWVPNLLQDIFQNPVKMGMIISFASLMSFLTDLVFPQILKGISVRALTLLSIIGIVVFSLILLVGINFPFLWIFLIAMAVWGTYYELILFSAQQFVSDSIPYKLHSSSWALIDVFKNLAYLLGPIMAGYLILTGQKNAAYGAILFSGISFLILFINRKVHDRPIEIDLSQVNIFKEIGHWRVLYKHVWPIVVLSLFLGIIDSIFWTTGAIWTEELAKQNFLGILLIPAYQIPPLFMGFVVAKWAVVSGKKKLALQYFLVACAFLATMGLSNFIPLHIFMVLISSIMLSVTYPMIEAVYSNIFVRMGRERKHLMGLSNSAGSLSYIIGPALGGFITSWVGEKMTFSVVGIAGVVVALILLAVTPRKLKLPQSEMMDWED